MAFGWLKTAGEGFLGKNQADISRPKYDTSFAQHDQTRQLESRAMQGEYGDMLREQMAGKGPSVAHSQLMAGRDAAIRAGMSTAASARGANVALAGRTAGQQAGQLGMQAAQQAAALRAQEQQAAMMQFGQLAQQQRLQDLMARGMSIDEAKAQLAADTAFMQTKANVGEGEASRGQMGYGALLAAAGGLLASDPAVKSNITPVGGPGQQDAYMNPYGAGVSPPDAWTSRGVLPALQPARQTLIHQPGRDQTAAMSGQQNVWDQMKADRAQQMQFIKDPMALDRTMAAQTPGMQQDAQAPNPVTSTSGMGGNPFTAAASALTGKDMTERLKDQAPAQKQGGGGLLSGLSGMFSAAGSALAGSDPQLKAGITSTASYPLAQSAAQVQPIAFNYKTPNEAATGTERRLGVPADKMPGNLSENPAYAATVFRGPDGVSRVDTPQATLANIAVTSDIARQQQEQGVKLDALANAIASKLDVTGGNNAQGDKKTEALRKQASAAAPRSAGGTQPAAFKGDFSQRQPPAAQVPGGDQSAVPYHSWPVAPGAAIDKKLAAGQGVGVTGGPDEGYKLQIPNMRYNTEGYAALKDDVGPIDYSFLEHSARPGDQIRTTGPTGGAPIQPYEAVVGDAAGTISFMEGDKAQRAKAINSLVENLSAGQPAMMTPDTIYKILKQRNVKGITKKEVADAMNPPLET